MTEYQHGGTMREEDFVTLLAKAHLVELIYQNDEVMECVNGYALNEWLEKAGLVGPSRLMPLNPIRCRDDGNLDEFSFIAGKAAAMAVANDLLERGWIISILPGDNGTFKVCCFLLWLLLFT